MAEERRQFPRRWPHLTTLYNSSPFISRGYKDVEDWNSLRPLPTIVGGYPPSYDDTYSRSGYGSYVGQRQFTGDKFGRSFVTAPPSNYDAFSLSTYQSLPIKRNNGPSKATGCLSFFIGLSLIISLIGAVVALVIVLNSGDKCDTYMDRVYVVKSPYDHSELLIGSDVYERFKQDFCTEIETAFERFYKEDHICGCLVDSVDVQHLFVNVTFNILYRRINATDNNSTLVGTALGNIMYTILNESRIERFQLSNVAPSETHVTKAPMASVGNLTTTTKQDTPALNTPSTASPTTQSSNGKGNDTASPSEENEFSNGTRANETSPPSSPDSDNATSETIATPASNSTSQSAGNATQTTTDVMTSAVTAAPRTTPGTSTLAPSISTATISVTPPNKTSTAASTGRTAVEDETTPATGTVAITTPTATTTSAATTTTTTVASTQQNVTPTVAGNNSKDLSSMTTRPTTRPLETTISSSTSSFTTRLTTENPLNATTLVPEVTPSMFESTTNVTTQLPGRSDIATTTKPSQATSTPNTPPPPPVAFVTEPVASPQLTDSPSLETTATTSEFLNRATEPSTTAAYNEAERKIEDGSSALAPAPVDVQINANPKNTESKTVTTTEPSTDPNVTSFRGIEETTSTTTPHSDTSQPATASPGSQTTTTFNYNNNNTSPDIGFGDNPRAASTDTPTINSTGNL